MHGQLWQVSSWAARMRLCVCVRWAKADDGSWEQCLFRQRSEVLLGMRSGTWDGDQMGDPESGPVWFFRWNNTEEATSPSECGRRSRGGTVGVSACCSLSVPTATARRLPDGRKLGARTIAIHSLVVVTCMHNNIICSCRLTGIFAWRRASIAFGRAPCASCDIAWKNRMGQHDARPGRRIELG